MIYVKCTSRNMKILIFSFWISSLLLANFYAPMFLVPLAILGLFHFSYIILEPLPLPIVLSFVAMIGLSTYTVYMNMSHV